MRTLFFLNHLTIPRIYLVTLWWGPTLRLGPTDVHYITLYKVYIKYKYMTNALMHVS